jgi:hypothetical protein
MMMAAHPNNMVPTSVDMDAFEQMVAQVQQQVAAIGKQSSPPLPASFFPTFTNQPQT